MVSFEGDVGMRRTLRKSGMAQVTHVFNEAVSIKEAFQCLVMATGI